MAINLTVPINFPKLYNLALSYLILIWWSNLKLKVPAEITLRLLTFLIYIITGIFCYNVDFFKLKKKLYEVSNDDGMHSLIWNVCFFLVAALWGFEIKWVGSSLNV